MTWSTRQIADLAGTTVRAVRHYHEVGLLPEPERHANGYKQYGVAHLVRVVRIKRLTDLGFSLSQISAMEDADEYPEQELRTLDAELAETIERLQRVRAELGTILREGTPTDLPPEIALATADVKLSETERSLIVVMTRVLGPRGLRAYAEMLRSYRTPSEIEEFDDLPPDADEHTRQDLAERLVPLIRDLFDEHPGLEGLNADAPGGARYAERTVGLAIKDVHHPAQLDVLQRIARLRQTP
jgi:DNA-binding transcriptional MerR regulator